MVDTVVINSGPLITLARIDQIAPLIAKAQAAGVRYDSRTVESFLINFGEVPDQ